jgi:predicted AAA+ superfamily ATPase
MIQRYLDLAAQLRRKSHFLFGPRGVGKTFLIRETLRDAVVIDLLRDEVYSRLIRNPSILSDMTPKGGSQIVVIDEIQKIPALLDEVHKIIEEQSITFLLTGSSARKLRRGGANPLGGRAWEMNLFPLTSYELGESFDLYRYLSYGGLPHVLLSEYPDDELRHYIKLYLREEIQAEGLTRRFDHFVRFLDFAALTSGDELNYESLGSDSGVPARTVASYYEVLEDTLVGFRVSPFRGSRKRKAIKRSKFYLFDVGVTGALTQRGMLQEQSELLGKALEHLIAMELRAYLSYTSSDLPLTFWRTETQHEVDFVIGEEVAIEVKATSRVSDSHLKGLRSLGEESIVPKRILVSRDPVRRITSDNIEVIPIREFLRELWSNALVRTEIMPLPSFE